MAGVGLPYTQIGIISFFILVLDIIAAVTAIKSLEHCRGIDIQDARGGRDDNLSLYRRCIRAVRQTAGTYGEKSRGKGIYVRALSKVKKAGYQSEYSAFVYLIVIYPLTAFFAVLALIINYPRLMPVVSVIVIFRLIPELVLVSGRKAINMKFQRYIYKIYKYLHNQVSSGVKVTDAIRTVYEVIDDRKLRNMFIRTAARYELTLDIDASLEEFRENFDVYEAEMLCTALKQGIETGDNKELLARQEDMMFKKYFNYIQSETDSCKNRSLLAVSMFTAVVVLMIIIPLINDMTDAVGRIFIN